MTQEEVIRNCENLLDGKQQDPLYQMMFMMMNMLPFFMQNKQRSEEALISLIVKAINLDGKSEIIAVEATGNESEATYTEFCQCR